MRHRNICNEINRENELRLLTPLLLGLALPFAVLILIILVVNFGPEIDAFASRHPLVTGWSLVALGVVGWFKFGRRTWLW